MQAKRALFWDFYQHNLAGLARWLLLVWLLAAIIAHRYFIHMTHLDGAQFGYLLLVVLGHFGILCLLAAVPLLLLAALVRKWIFVFLASLYFAIILNCLLVDTFVFNLYKIHLSWYLVDLLRYGGNDLINFSPKMWHIGIAVQFLIFVLVLLAGWLCFAYKLFSKRQLKWAYASILLAALGYNVWHAWADANYENNIQVFKQHIPIYYPATAKKFFYKTGLVRKTQSQDLKIKNHHNPKSYQNFHYPLADLSFKPDTPKYNILVILVDALRFDTFSPTYTPHAYAFAQQKGAWRAQRHLAGANATEAGVFALFYSLPSRFYFALAKGVPPVLMQTMMARDYQFKILSSANLISPAFTSNVFSGIANIAMRTKGDNPNERDEQITRDWLAFTKARSAQKNPPPFFGFLFYDSVHGYLAPKNFPKFLPYQKEMNYLKLSNDFEVTPYFNKYRTAAKYTDTLVGKVLADLKKRDLLKNTVVIFSADHGEEFNDNKQNYWGHISNFSYAQTHVPMVMYIPKTKGGDIQKRTSHYDIAPTLMQLIFGNQDPIADYAFGNNLFAKREIKYIYAGSYVHNAVMMDEGYLVFNNDGSYDIFDYHMQKPPPEDIKKILKTAYQAQIHIGRFMR